MQNKKIKKPVIISIEDTSILRKFTELFFIMSIVPLLVIVYLYFQIKNNGALTITPQSISWALVFVVLGITSSYIGMRRVIKRLIDLADENKKALREFLTPQQIEEIGHENNEIAVLTQSFSAITNRLEENVKSLEEAKRTLHNVMAKVGQGVANMKNIDTFLNLIIETVTDALLGKVGVIMLYSSDSKELSVKSVYGVKYDSNDEITIKIDNGSMLHNAIVSKKPIIIPKMILGSQEEKYSFLFDAPAICSPMYVRSQISGLIAVSGRRSGGETFDADEINLMHNLALQTAVAIENSKLNEDIEKTYFETITALAMAVDAKDRYSRGHLDRVANYCIQIGTKLGLDEGDIRLLRDAARLHDIGKIGIADDILSKEGELTDQEWILMRKHPEIGESIIKPIRSLQNLCDIIRHHHEKLDGSGYPDGLKGEEISSLVRIAAVADVYDAITTSRSYRKKLTIKEAYQIMRSMKDELDQDIVEIFIESLEESATA